MKWHLSLVVRLVILLSSFSLIANGQTSGNLGGDELDAAAAIEDNSNESIDEKNSEMSENRTAELVESVDAEPMILSTTGISQDHSSGNSVNEAKPAVGLVEIRYPEAAQGAYLESRGTHGFMVDVNYQFYTPKGFLSALDNGTYDASYGGNQIGITELQLDYKYNFNLGGLTLGLGFGNGSTSSAASGSERKIALTKESLAFGYIMDAIWPEPYLAPYFQLQAWQMQINEADEKRNFSGETKIGFNYRIGTLIQLNWLDESTAETGAHGFGLDNTYLDLFVAKYSQTQSSTDANTESDFNVGAGLRLEY